jgi:hypothetical protein
VIRQLEQGLACLPVAGFKNGDRFEMREAKMLAQPLAQRLGELAKLIWILPQMLVESLPDLVSAISRLSPFFKQGF